MALLQEVQTDRRNFLRLAAVAAGGLAGLGVAIEAEKRIERQVYHQELPFEPGFGWSQGEAAAINCSVCFVRQQVKKLMGSTDGFLPANIGAVMIDKDVDGEIAEDCGAYYRPGPDRHQILIKGFTPREDSEKKLGILYRKMSHEMAHAWRHPYPQPIFFPDLVFFNLREFVAEWESRLIYQEATRGGSNVGQEDHEALLQSYPMEKVLGMTDEEVAMLEPGEIYCAGGNLWTGIERTMPGFTKSLRQRYLKQCHNGRLPYSWEARKWWEQAQPEFLKILNSTFFQKADAYSQLDFETGGRNPKPPGGFVSGGLKTLDFPVKAD